MDKQKIAIMDAESGTISIHFVPEELEGDEEGIVAHFDIGSDSEFIVADKLIIQDFTK